MIETFSEPQSIDKRYVVAKSIALALLDMPLDERADALAAACRGDTDLQQEVQWLLDAAGDVSLDEGMRLTLDDPLATRGMHVEAPVLRDYRVLRRIGEGGMGVVYLAERIDGQLQQRVALKLLHPLPDADVPMQRRFAIERRILSTLSHPNIAHLIDGGVTATGRPFLAMEYVDGERIDTYCGVHALSLHARVALFLKVCAAVEHAHRRLVVHRDIKPSNILVDSEGEPKLLDFGIARLLDDVEVEQTRTGARVLTLAYASPEQIEGRPLGTMSDVYSLGVLLYLLIAGVRPFDHLGTSLLQTQAIVSGDVSPPSRRASDQGPVESADATRRRLRRTLRRRRVPADLDAIVLKAMRREPEQRYPTAGALAADLRRFLSDRPVRARRGDWRYRLTRFIWRRRWAVAAAAIIAIGLSTFAVDRVRQLSRIAIERDRANAVVQYMDALYQNTDALHLRGKDVTVRQMLDLGASSLRERSGLSPGNQAELLVATGRAYNALGLARDALPLLEQARDILARPDADADAEQRAALSLALAASYSGSRRLEQAMAADEDALRYLGEAPSAHVDEIAKATIRLLHNHAVTLDMPLEQIRERLDRVLADLERRPGAPESLKISAYLALAMAYGSDNKGALAAAERAMEIATHVYPSGDPRLLPARSVYVSAVQQDDPEKAAALLSDLIADHERRMGASVHVASLLGNFGSTLIRIGKPGDAVPVFERALAMTRDVAGEDSQLYRLASCNFAEAQLALGNGDRAVELIERVLPGLVSAAQVAGNSEEQVFLASAREVLAEAAVLRGESETAEDEFSQAAVALSRIEKDAYPEMYSRILLRLAQVQYERGRHESSARTLDTLDAGIAARTDAASAGFRSRSQSMRAALADHAKTASR
ncbi:MAG: serine/threonine-protein kinase [Dokdonella sp.]